LISIKANEFLDQLNNNQLVKDFFMAWRLVKHKDNFTFTFTFGQGLPCVVEWLKGRYKFPFTSICDKRHGF